MKVYKSQKVYKYQLESTLVMLLCVDVAYINTIFHDLPNIQFVGRLIMMVYLFLHCVLHCVYNRHHISKTLKFIVFFVLWILFITYLRGGETFEALKIFSAPLLMCIYVEQKCSSTQVYGCISVWSDILLGFVLIDFVTQVIFPNGMYKDSMYSLNWFLGYKTSRLAFSMPLCVFSSITSMKQKGKLTLKTWSCYFLSVITLLFSQATAASITILIECILIVLVCFNRKKQFSERLWEKVLNLKFVLIIYSAISVLVVFVQNSPQIQYFIVNVFHKDSTLTTRTYIWNLCMASLEKHPFTGLGYLSSVSYQNLTNNMYATSAHNMSLSILLSGGLIGLAVYITIMIAAWKGFNENATVEKKISSIGVIVLLIVGLTSSSMVFSACAFIFFELMNILNLTYHDGQLSNYKRKVNPKEV